jgi:small basic protein
MATVVNLVLFGVVLAVHTLIAAVMVRFFRIRLKTRWGSAVYAVALIPVVLLATTLVFTGVLGIGVDLGSPVAVLGVMIGMPMTLGATIDLLYVPSPEEYELPETT